MAKRRTLGDGLEPEIERFLYGDAHPKEKKAKPKTKQKAKPKPKQEEPSMSQAALLKQPLSQPFETAGVSPNQHGLVGLTTRIRPVVSELILRVALERKLHRRNAATMQEIVDEALTDWLIKNGYLNL